MYNVFNKYVNNNNRKGGNNVKSKGLVRKVDDLGRVTLAKEDREILGIGKNDFVEMTRIGDEIKIKKYQKTCNLCNNQLEAENSIDIEGKII